MEMKIFLGECGLSAMVMPDLLEALEIPASSPGRSGPPGPNRRLGELYSLTATVPPLAFHVMPLCTNTAIAQLSR